MKTLCLLILLFIFTQNMYAQFDTSYHGIKWTEGLTWEQVKQKAKKENKYIFLDCFATWCAPCHAMDKNVFSNDIVAQLMNEKFIAIKIQMDRTSQDDSVIKRWYSEAKRIQANFTVNAFPTFLFFDSNTKPLHRAVGYKSIKEFKNVILEVFDSTKQYYSVLANFRSGVIDTSEMKGLARDFKGSSDELDCRIAADYLIRVGFEKLNESDNLKFAMEFNTCPQVQLIVNNFLKTHLNELDQPEKTQLVRSFNKTKSIQELVINYLTRLPFEQILKKEIQEIMIAYKGQPEIKDLANRYFRSLSGDEIYEKNNLLLLVNFTESSSDFGFPLFYQHGEKIDSILKSKSFNSESIYFNKNTSQNIVDQIIKKEEIEPYWQDALDGKNISWQSISKKIKKKYKGEYADRNVLQAKVVLYKYFTQKQNAHWDDYIKYNIELIDKYGTDTTSGFIDATVINNFAWYAVFYHCNNKGQIIKVTKWMEGVVRRDIVNDIKIDTYANLLYKIGKKTEALKWEKKALELAVKGKNDFSAKSYELTIEKMMNDKPTW